MKFVLVVGLIAFAVFQIGTVTACAPFHLNIQDVTREHFHKASNLCLAIYEENYYILSMPESKYLSPKDGEKSFFDCLLGETGFRDYYDGKINDEFIKGQLVNNFINACAVLNERICGTEILYKFFVCFQYSNVIPKL